MKMFMSPEDHPDLLDFRLLGTIKKIVNVKVATLLKYNQFADQRQRENNFIQGKSLDQYSPCWAGMA